MGHDKKIQKAVPALKASQFDYTEFQDIWGEPDIPDDQKQELFEILWAIALDFVDMGFGIHPVQLAKTASDNVARDDTELTTQPDEENQPERSDV